jgi:hypothetical protein
MRLSHGVEHLSAIMETVGILEFGYAADLLRAFSSVLKQPRTLVAEPSGSLAVDTAQRPYVDILAHS